MKYIITDGNNYITYVKSGITICGNIKTAFKFEKCKADNVIKSLPKTFKKFNWRIEKYTEDRQEHDVKIGMEIYKGLTDNILEKMLEWENYIKQLKEYMVVIDSELLKVKSEIQDIEHAAEFFDLDMFRAWKLYKMLQASRRRRRKLKEDKAKIQYILDSNFQDCTKSAISNYMNSLNSQTYVPRVYQELFE